MKYLGASTRPADQRDTIHRTPNPKCSACVGETLHTSEDWKHHPDAGHGFTPETGWTKRGLEASR